MARGSAAICYKCHVHVISQKTTVHLGVRERNLRALGREHGERGVALRLGAPPPRRLSRGGRGCGGRSAPRVIRGFGQRDEALRANKQRAFECERGLESERYTALKC